MNHRWTAKFIKSCQWKSAALITFCRTWGGFNGSSPCQIRSSSIRYPSAAMSPTFYNDANQQWLRGNTDCQHEAPWLAGVKVGGRPAAIPVSPRWRKFGSLISWGICRVSRTMVTHQDFEGKPSMDSKYNPNGSSMRSKITSKKLSNLLEDGVTRTLKMSLPKYAPGTRSTSLCIKVKYYWKIKGIQKWHTLNFNEECGIGICDAQMLQNLWLINTIVFNRSARILSNDAGQVAMTRAFSEVFRNPTNLDKLTGTGAIGPCSLCDSWGKLRVDNIQPPSFFAFMIPKVWTGPTGIFNPSGVGK